MKRSMIIAVIVGTLSGFGGLSLADMNDPGSETTAKIQRVHRLMGRAMGMVTEGAGLVLIAKMRLAPPTDSITADQGMKMIENGKNLVQMALAGEGMPAMEKKEMQDEPMMEMAQSLGESILKYVKIVENMEMSGTTQSKIKLHRVHLMINHALDMAAEGANLVMLGNLNLAEQLDKYTVEQGRMMLKDARASLTGVSDSKAMKDMKQGEMGSMDDTGTARANQLIETALTIIDALERMSM